MANLVAELNSLDFSVYIGGPLQAAVQAQHAASMSQVEFIRNVGFETVAEVPAGPGGIPAAIPEHQKLRYVDFEYEKSIPNPEYDPAYIPGVPNYDPNNIKTKKFISKKVAIKVPFLTMLTIPALRIEEMTIDFNAKLTSTETSNVSTELGITASLGINYKVVNFKASASYKRTSATGTSVEKTYNLGVHVKAVNDEIPAGLDRILTMLEDSIASVNE